MAIIRKQGMAWIGKIVKTEPIPEADKIQRAVVVCGAGGKWGAVVPKTIGEESVVVCFLPDAIVPKGITVLSFFMEKHGWRVKPMRLRGCPSEVLAIPHDDIYQPSDCHEIGTDVTDGLGVMKYEKEMPMVMSGEAVGSFPIFIPKTDELNFQTAPHLVEAVKGKEVYVTVKADGSSQTVFMKDGVIRACSRNLELKENPDVAVWKLIEKYGLREKLVLLGREMALQWECVGPGIQGNPLQLKEVDLRLFQIFDIDKQMYLDFEDFWKVAAALSLPTVDLVFRGVLSSTEDESLRKLAEGVYRESGKQREGIVIRPTTEMVCKDRVTFKVLNLLYKEQAEVKPC